jgi:hypothetical protein
MSARRLLTAALAAAVAALAGPAGEAVAGTMSVYLGSTPEGVPVPAGPWSNLSYGTVAGGAFGVQVANGAGAGWSSTATLAFPAGLSATTAVANRFYTAPAMAAVYQPGFTTSFENVGYPAEAFGCTGHEWDLCYVSRSGDGNVTAVSPSGLSLTAHCVTFGGSDPSPRCLSGAAWAARRMAITFTDASAPTASLTGTGGAMTSGAWQTSATGALAVTSADVGSGTYRAIMRIGGVDAQTVAIDPSDVRCTDARPGVGGPYEFAATTASLVPCPLAAEAYAPAFELAALGDGTHTGVDFLVEDASGNRTTVASGVVLRINAPGGALVDPGTPCTNGTYDASGTCVARVPSNTSAPTLTGDPDPGGTLTTDTGAWNDVSGASYDFAWELCDAAGSGCHVIPGQTGSSLSVTGAHVGGTLRSVVTATTIPGGSTVSRSAVTPVVLSGVPSGPGGAGGLEDVELPSGGPGGSGRGGGLLGFEVATVDLPVPASGGAGAVAVGGRNGEFPENAVLALRASLATGSRTRTYGSTNTITGTLTTQESGYPVRNAQVDVVVHVARQGARGSIAGAVRTDERGRFRFAIPVGPSRIYSFGHRLSLSDTTYAQVTHVAVPIAPEVGLRASATRVRRGATVALSGTVVGADRGSRKLVQLQVRHGRAWTTFATTRLRNGRFAYRQRFTRTIKATRYRVRARVERDANWPLATGRSRALTVTVRRAAAKRPVQR